MFWSNKESMGKIESYRFTNLKVNNSDDKVAILYNGFVGVKRPIYSDQLKQ